jgi:raffinose/stachyose/melibiose transport system substrate-binding protein
MRHPKAWLALAIVAALALVVVMPAAAQAKPTIRFAHLWVGKEGFAGKFIDGLDKWTKANAATANWVIEAEQGDNLRNKIKTDLAADNLPDAFYYWALSSLKTMIDAGYILDVKQFINASKKTKWEQFPQGAWDEYTYDKKQYWGIPSTGFKDFILCNKELFKKYNQQYPKTYADLLKVSKVFADAGIIPMAVGSKGGNPSHFYFAEVYYQFGTLEYMQGVATGKTKFNDPLNIKAANLVLEMVNNRVFPKDPIATGEFTIPVALYNEGKAAMILTESWTIPNFTAESVARSDFITFPKFPDAKNDPATFTVGGVNNGWVINAKSFADPKKKQAIVDIMDFAVSDDVYSWFAQSGSFIFKNITLPKDVPPLYTKVLDFTKNQKPLTNFWILMPDPVSQEVISTAMDKLWTKQVNAQQFVDEVQASVDKALKK